MWPFRSRTQKKLDALQGVVNDRLRVVGAALEMFTGASDEFKRLKPAFSDEDCKEFILTQSQHQYFTNALLDEISEAESSIELIRTAAENYDRAEPVQIAAELIDLERRLARTELTCRSLGAACGRMAEATGLRN